MSTNCSAQELRADLERVALDLHVHTPASSDWRDGVVTPEQIVERALAQGLDGIAVTDHESGQLIDQLRTAAAGRDLTILPGVEINNLAGKEGIHLVALLKLETTARDIDHFLVSIQALTGPWGSSTL